MNTRSSSTGKFHGQSLYDSLSSQASFFRKKQSYTSYFSVFLSYFRAHNQAFPCATPPITSFIFSPIPKFKIHNTTFIKILIRTIPIFKTNILNNKRDTTQCHCHGALTYTHKIPCRIACDAAKLLLFSHNNTKAKCCRNDHSHRIRQ